MKTLRLPQVAWTATMARAMMGMPRPGGRRVARGAVRCPRTAASSVCVTGASQLHRLPKGGGPADDGAVPVEVHFYVFI